MTKMQICDNIVSAWEKITPDMIRKSFEICGQILRYDPDNLLYMRKGMPCEQALPKLKELLAFPIYQLDLEALNPLPEGMVPMDYNILDDVEENDPLLL